MRLLEWRHGNEAAGMEAWEWDLGLPWISNINFTVTNMNNNLHMYNVCKHITTNTHTATHTHRCSRLGDDAVLLRPLLHASLGETGETRRPPAVLCRCPDHRHREAGGSIQVRTPNSTQ